MTDRLEETTTAWDRVAGAPDARAAIHPAGTDDDAYAASGAEWADKVADVLGPVAGRIVDFGCGDGRVTIPLDGHYPDQVAAMDASPVMLRRLEDRWPTTSGAVTLAVGAGTDPDAFDGLHPISAIVALAVLIHHTHADTTRILETFAAVLEPGGRIVTDLSLYEVSREPESWCGVAVWTRAQIERVAARCGLLIASGAVSAGEFQYHRLGAHHGDLMVLRKATGAE